MNAIAIAGKRSSSCTRYFSLLLLLLLLISSRNMYMGLISQMHHNSLLFLVLDCLDVATINLAIAKLMGSFNTNLVT